MKFLKKNILLVTLLFVLTLSSLLRLYNLNGIPAGLHADEASQGFNAYSLANTGKDMYGKKYPVLFRASGSYQPPVYTYLSIIPVNIIGNTGFSIRLISALSGILLPILTFIFVRIWKKNEKNGETVALIASIVIAIAPWAVHFSRIAVEANLALTIFVSSLILFSLSLKKPGILPLAAFVLGLSTHTYYSERIIAVLFLPLFIFFFRKIFLKNTKAVIIAFVVFFLTQIPHILLFSTGALTRRLDQVSYLSTSSPLAAVWQFVRHFLMYLSPGTLFFDPGDNLGRSSPELSVFYNWFIIPFLFGLRYVYKNREQIFPKLLLLLIILSLVPAALTGDLFYPLRTLDYLWLVSIVVALGLFSIWTSIRSNLLRTTIFLVLFIYSLGTLFVSYFILFKYEEPSANYGYSLGEFIRELPKYRESRVWIDFNPRFWGAGIQLAYLTKANPAKVQSNLSSQMQTPYYSGTVNAGEVYRLDNVMVKPIEWTEVCGKDLIVVGDEMSISPAQVSEHKLIPVLSVPNTFGKPALYGYSPTSECKDK